MAAILSKIDVIGGEGHIIHNRNASIHIGKAVKENI